MKKPNENVMKLFSHTGTGEATLGGQAKVAFVPASGAKKPKPSVMLRRSAATRPLSPATASALKGMGEAIRNARKARKLTIEALAKRAGIAKKTLLAIEAGTGSTSTAGLLEVISVLDTGLIESFVERLRADPVGKALLDARLPERTRTERF